MPSVKPVVAMIGGVACDETLWDDVVARLGGAADCRPILPPGDSIEAMAEAVVRALPEGPFALVGHSMGGYVALAIQRAVPNRVSRLALIGSGSNGEASAQREARLALMDLVRKRSFEAMLDRLVPAMVSAETRADPAMMARLEAMVRRAGAERFLRQQTAVMNRPEAQSALAAIRVPTLVVAGAGDRIVAPQFGRETADRIPGAAFRLLARCGHIAPVERADAVGDLLSAWLADEPLPPQEPLD